MADTARDLVERYLSADGLNDHERQCLCFFESTVEAMAEEIIEQWGADPAYAEGEFPTYRELLNELMEAEKRLLGFEGGPIAFYKSGALMADRKIEGLTNGPIGDSSLEYYGGRWMLCETLSEGAAKKIAAALGLRWSDVPVTKEGA